MVWIIAAGASLLFQAGVITRDTTQNRICRLFFPGMPHRHILRQLELLAKEVMPAFR
jgi:hypothetical protein